MATTHNWTTGSHGVGFGSEHEILGGYKGVVVRYFDCSVTANNLTGSDIYQVIKVDNGMMPTQFRVYVVTAEGDATTLDIGDGSSTARYETDADLNATGHTATLDATTMYTAADTIDLIPSADCDAAKFYVVMEYIRLTT
jgi:hypothetical protein